MKKYLGSEFHELTWISRSTIDVTRPRIGFDHDLEVDSYREVDNHLEVLNPLH